MPLLLTLASQQRQDPSSSLSLPAARLLRNAFKQLDYRREYNTGIETVAGNAYAITPSDTRPKESP